MQYYNLHKNYNRDVFIQVKKKIRFCEVLKKKNIKSFGNISLDIALSNYIPIDMQTIKNFLPNTCLRF